MGRGRHSNRHWAAPACLALVSFAAGADYRDDIGETRLRAELSAAAPTGRGVPVLLGEAIVFVDHDGNPATPSVPAWLPDPANPAFSGKTILDRSGATPGAYSGHATGVAELFFGTQSIAPAITQIDAYRADDWLGPGFLYGGVGNPPPGFTAARVGNHSYVGSTGNLQVDGDLLRRMDWLSATDEFLHCVGLTNGSANQPILASAFNVIAVGRTDGSHGIGSAGVDAVYSAGRVRPDVVAPQSTTSAATPLVAAAAALLIQAGHEHPDWSTDPVTVATTNRAGITVYNAERVEVIKAALMAGADRFTINSGGANIHDYRTNPSDRAANGLDRRFGAGQLNIHASYHILAAGEQNSREDLPSAAPIGKQGFDYDPAFGGASGTNPTGTYEFTTGPAPEVLTVALVWNLAVDGGSALVFDGTSRLHDLNLKLLDANTGATVMASTSTTETTEHLWLPLEPNRAYRLRVEAAEGVAPFAWDYALAWRREVDTDGDGVADRQDNCTQLANADQRDSDGDGYGNRCDADLNNDGTVNFADLAALRAVFFSNDANADLNRDGVVNFADLAILKSLFFKAPGPTGRTP